MSSCIMTETKTISLVGSDELFWEDVEKHSRKHGFKTTSGYIQYLLERDMLGVKTKIRDVITYIMLLLIMAMILLMLLVRGV